MEQRSEGPTGGALGVIAVDEEALATAGFVSSGVTRFRADLEDYCRQLFDRSIALARAYRIETRDPIEVTAQHVADTVLQLRSRPAPEPSWVRGVELAGYLLTAAVGVFASNIKAVWGYLGFFLSLATGLIAFWLVLDQRRKGGRV